MRQIKAVEQVPDELLPVPPSMLGWHWQAVCGDRVEVLHVGERLCAWLTMSRDEALKLPFLKALPKRS